MPAPTNRHVRLLKRVLRYIYRTRNHGLHYCRVGMLRKSSSAALYSDWARCIETRCLTTGYLLSINVTPVYWRSKRHTIITLSSGEAEYVALSTCPKELTWIRKLFAEIFTQKPCAESRTMGPTTAQIDSSDGASIASPQNISWRKKHISLKFYHVRGV